MTPGSPACCASTPRMEQFQNKRSDYLDILKALGIIAVVYGHANAPFSRFVFLYHLAIFFFVSGFFYKDSYTQNPVSLIRKRIKTLYLPFIAYGLVFGILHNYFYRINLYSDRLQAVHNQTVYLATSREYVINILKILSFAKLEQLLAPLWFLPVLFCVNMLFLAVNYAIHRFQPARRDLWLAVSIFSLFCLGFVYYPEQNIFLRPVSIAMVVTIMFYFGSLFKKYESDIVFNGAYAFVCFLVLAISTSYGPIDTGGHQFVSPPFYLAISLCGIYLNLSLARMFVRETAFKKLLVFCGRNTITILALHFLAFRLVNYLQVKLHDLPPYMTAQHPVLNTQHGWWAAYLAAGLGLPLLARLIYDRLKQMLLSKKVSPTVV